MGDVFDLVDHMVEQPPAHRILAWRYLKPTPSRARGAKAVPLKDEEVHEISSALGVQARPMPDKMREMAEWVAKDSKRLKQPGEKVDGKLAGTR